MQWSLASALAVAGLLLSAVVPGGSAHEADGHPARIQKGSCDNLGGVAHQLTGVGASITAEGTPVPAPETVGSADAFPVQVGETTLDTTLSALTKQPHAIVVYESDEAMNRVIACGDVGGALTGKMPGDELAIWLAAVGDSGFVGVGLLEAKGKQAILRLFLAEGLQGEANRTAADDEHEEYAGNATPHAD